MGAILRNTIASLGVVAMLGASLYGEAKYGTGFDKYETVQTTQGEIKTPLFNEIKLKPLMCSSYARQASEEMFGKKFSKGSDAWDRRYIDKLVDKVSNQTVYEKIDQGVLKPGMIVGVFNPKSTHLNDIDMMGFKVGDVSYTHNMVYIGQRKSDGEAMFCDEFGSTKRVIGMKDIEKKGLSLKEIIDTWE